MTTPADLRDEALATVAHAADPRIVLMIDALIAQANASGEAWSANTIRHHLPVCDHHLVGARVRAAALRRPVEQVAVGYVASNLPSTHAHPIRRWIGTQHIQEGAA